MELLLELFQRLYDRYGPQGWWPGADSPLEVIVGAILTQATSWGNVERALHRLRAASLLELEALLALPEEKLAEIIRSAGFFRVKARRLRSFLDYLQARMDGDLDGFLGWDGELIRQELLAIPGIGPETADAILLYAAGRPFFVVDAYTERIMRRLAWWNERAPYEERQAWFHLRLPRDPALYNEFHALLVRHGKETCQRQPRCTDCILLDRCAYGQEGGHFRSENTTSRASR